MSFAPPDNSAYGAPFYTNGHAADYNTQPSLAATTTSHNMLPTPSGPHHYAGDGQRFSQSFSSGDRVYSLIVEQQPDRARMCGFGDKDRRPITPPPCVRLVIQDVHTGKEVDFSEVDSQHFILNVDLWDASGQQEVNLVRHSNTTPSVSISMASTTSYPPPPEHVIAIPGPPGQPHQYRPVMLGQHGEYYQGQVPGYPYPPHSPAGAMVPQASPTAGMFTRNLIGSVTVSVSQLSDLSDKPGFWFVLQDLSVRTEGSFRLKFSFINVGLGNGQLNTGHCPVLASTMSDVFTVWSAKKFPGVKESTALSKCFATQGVKIPIRKDGSGKGNGKDDDLDD